MTKCDYVAEQNFKGFYSKKRKFKAPETAQN